MTLAQGLVRKKDSAPCAHTGVEATEQSESKNCKMLLSTITLFESVPSNTSEQ